MDLGDTCNLEVLTIKNQESEQYMVAEEVHFIYNFDMFKEEKYLV